MEITYDSLTWPTGDKIWDACRAIAIAEGANKEGSNPDRLNNPGDLSDDFSTYGGESHSGSDITHYPDKWTGWEALYHKVHRIASGNSTVYSPCWTWTKLAQKYAGNWENWVTNVTRELGVEPDSIVNDFFQMSHCA